MYSSANIPDFTAEEINYFYLFNIIEQDGFQNPDSYNPNSCEEQKQNLLFDQSKMIICYCNAFIINIITVQFT